MLTYSECQVYQIFKTDLCHRVFDDLLSSHITFVANQQLVHIFAGIAVNFSEPLTNVVERLLPKCMPEYIKIKSLQIRMTTNFLVTLNII